MAKQQAKVPVTKKVSASTKTPVTKPKTPVTPANNVKYTDWAKKEAKINAGPGVSLAKPGSQMRLAQDMTAKQKSEAFKKKYGSYPTEAFMKQYKAKYGKYPT